jgi:hypothetical protein
MQLSLSPSNLLLWGLLTSLGYDPNTNTSLAILTFLPQTSSAAPAPQGEILTLPGGIPPTCIKFEDGVIKTPSCYTRTTTTKPSKFTVSRQQTP